VEKLGEIQRKLEALATPEARAAYQKSVKTGLRLYGVRTPLLNQLAKEYWVLGFDLVDALWGSGAYEERLLAAKVLGRLARKSPAQTWNRIQSFVPDLSDWAICDTLATQSIRGALSTMADAIFVAGRSFAAEDGEWPRRFGLVVLTNFAKDEIRVPDLLAVLQTVSTDRRHYVKMAADWLRRDLEA